MMRMPLWAFLLNAFRELMARPNTVETPCSAAEIISWIELAFDIVFCFVYNRDMETLCGFIIFLLSLGLLWLGIATDTDIIIWDAKAILGFFVLAAFSVISDYF